MELQTIIGSVAGILTGISSLPQLVKMIKERKATDISVAMVATLLLGLAFWVWYGVLRKDWPIIVTNCLSFTINILILVLRAYYKKK